MVGPIIQSRLQSGERCANVRQNIFNNGNARRGKPRCIAIGIDDQIINLEAQARQSALQQCGAIEHEK